MAKQDAVKADAKELKRSQDMWEHFTKLMTISIMATVGVVAALGLVFIDW